VTDMRHSKRGAITIFIAFILSALVLIECTFLVFVWDLDYRLTLNEAARSQVETILAEYNRQLLDIYGIYAFSIDTVDSDVFDKALQASGYDTGDTVAVFAEKELSSEDLKEAISVYYEYRGSAVLMQLLYVQIGELLEQADTYGIMETLRGLTSSKAAGYIEDILSGASTVSSLIDKAKSLDSDFDYESAEGDTRGLRGILSDVREADNDLEDIGLDMRLSDLSSLISGLDTIMGIRDGASSAVMTVAIHPAIAHYASHNFDCIVPNENDTTINGTKYTDIHDKNYLDAEYILCGLDGRLGAAFCSMAIYGVLLCKNVISNLADETLRSTLDVISAALAAILAVVTEGVVVLDPEIITTILTVLISAAQSVYGLIDVLKGGSITLFEVQEAGVGVVCYRDFLNAFMMFVPDTYLLERMRYVLNRDYGELYTGARADVTYRNQLISIDKSYALYR